MRTLRRILSFLLCVCVLAAPLLPARADGRETVRVGFFPFEGYHITAPDGTRSGYGYEYLQEIAKYTNWRYEYVDGTFQECLDMLERGEIDLLTSVSQTEAREERYLFTKESIGIKDTILTVRMDDDRFFAGDTAGLDGIRVGMLQGNTSNLRFAEFAVRNNFNYIYEDHFEDVGALQAALETGRVDAILTSNLRLHPKERIIAEFAPAPYYIAVRLGDDALLATLDAALEQIGIENPLFEDALYEKYYGAGNGFALTAAEQAYLASLGTVRFAIMPDLAPLVSTENGALAGIAGGVLGRITEMAGIAAKYEMFDNYEAFDRYLLSGEAEAVGLMYHDLYGAERRDIRLTAPYLTLSFSMLTPLGGVTGDRIVAARRGSMFTRDYVERNFPKEDIRYYDSIDECVAAVRTGEATMTGVNTYAAERIVADDVRNQLVSTLINGYTLDLVVGVSGSADPRLFSILNKCVGALPEAEVSTIITDNTVYRARKISAKEYLAQHPERFLIAVVLLCALASVLVWLGMRRNRRLKELALVREAARFAGIAARANGSISELDLARGLRIDYAFRGDQLEKRIVPLNMQENLRQAEQGAVHGADLEAFQKAFSPEALAALAATDGERSLEVRVRQGEERYRWMYLTLQGIPADPEHPNNLLLFRRDIDDTRCAEEEKTARLREALATAEVASRAKGEFMSRMSHEIRTPLNAIIGFLSLAKMSADTPDRVTEYLGKAEFASKHLLSIINDVLDMSAIESGKIRLVNAPFDLGTFLSGFSSIFHAQAEEKGVRFETYLTGVTEERLRGDATRLNQILVNLVSNAVKFTPAGGRVTLSVDQKAVRAGRVHIRIRVADTGVGMSEEFMSRIGQPFEQQNAETGARFGGTGLGLSITKSLVMLMDGTLSYESRLGEGSTFSVDLPFELDTANTPQYAVDKAFGETRALVIDDELGTCEYTALLLKNFGAHCDYATSGDEAVERVKEAFESPDAPGYNLCLIDWKMPGMDGVETTRRIRAIRGADMPIVVVTSYNYQDIIEEAREAGATMFLAKPLFQSSVFNLLLQIRGRYEIAETAESRKHSFAGRRVLLAEDNDLNMEIASELLKRAGFTVVPAANGKEALDSFESSQPGAFDVILMDVQMPVMDGHEATRRIRASKHPDAARVPILAMTANAFTEDVSAALAAGMNNHVAKPIDIDQFMEVLAQYVPEARR